MSSIFNDCVPMRDTGIGRGNPTTLIVGTNPLDLIVLDLAVGAGVAALHIWLAFISPPF